MTTEIDDLFYSAIQMNSVRCWSKTPIFSMWKHFIFWWERILYEPSLKSWFPSLVWQRRVETGEEIFHFKNHDYKPLTNAFNSIFLHMCTDNKMNYFTFLSSMSYSWFWCSNCRHASQTFEILKLLTEQQRNSTTLHW